MPDNRKFGISWIRRAGVAVAIDMKETFKEVSLTLESTVHIEAVTDTLDDLLAHFGGQGAYDRDQQQSNAFTDAEIKHLRSLPMILPPVFFSISAFLVAMVMGRIVTLERSEIGLLKALG